MYTYVCTYMRAYENKNTQTHRFEYSTKYVHIYIFYLSIDIDIYIYIYVYIYIYMYIYIYICTYIYIYIHTSSRQHNMYRYICIYIYIYTYICICTSSRHHCACVPWSKVGSFTKNEKGQTMNCELFFDQIAVGYSGMIMFYPLKPGYILSSCSLQRLMTKMATFFEQEQFLIFTRNGND